MSSKGQVVIPRTIRAARGWEAGLEIEVEDTPQGDDMHTAVPPGYADDS